MAEQSSPGAVPGRPGGPEPEPHVRPLSIGGVVFAVFVLAIVGGFHAIAGLATILNHNYSRAQGDYAFDFSVTARGWVELVTGIVVAAAAFNIFSGKTWARAVGMAAAVVSALENFFFTPYYPVWSAILIVLDIVVIWSLAVYGHREAHKVYGAPLR
ncbi:DUF7144 family membrane protein [Phaeacidiphilus oryzae]|jgi:hypothetical protein|uniref:DUF7144 family membrane protein n=1 Tax=Phaeacidiphilus oryzae TaxID=348818 RepID=UPI00056D5D68|nr:hypothetical protein [Phaeacidiphilus oryzae]